MKARSWLFVWVMMSVWAITGSPVLADWLETFEDGDKVAWREHAYGSYDVQAFSAVAGVGKGGGYGYQRTGLTYIDYAEGIYCQYHDGTNWQYPGLMPALAVGDIHQTFGDLFMHNAPSNSRTGITWGYESSNWDIVHYQLVVESASYIELMKFSIRNTTNITLATGTPKSAGYFNDKWLNLRATYERTSGGLLIKGYLDGVKELEYLDTTPFACMSSGGYYAGVNTGFFSTPDYNVTVFDNLGASVIPATPPTPVTVHGTVVLDNYTGDVDPAGPVPVAVRVELRQGVNTVLVTQKKLDGNGQFSLDNVTPGTYNVAIKACCWLQKVTTGVTISDNLTDLGTFTLISGDSDGDNEVTSSDLSIVLAGMDTNGE